MSPTPVVVEPFVVEDYVLETIEGEPTLVPRILIAAPPRRRFFPAPVRARLIAAPPRRRTFPAPPR